MARYGDSVMLDFNFNENASIHTDIYHILLSIHHTCEHARLHKLYAKERKLVYNTVQQESREQHILTY